MTPLRRGSKICWQLIGLLCPVQLVIKQYLQTLFPSKLSNNKCKPQHQSYSFILTGPTFPMSQTCGYSCWKMQDWAVLLFSFLFLGSNIQVSRWELTQTSTEEAQMWPKPCRWSHFSCNVQKNLPDWLACEESNVSTSTGHTAICICWFCVFQSSKRTKHFSTHNPHLKLCYFGLASQRFFWFFLTSPA